MWKMIKRYYKKNKNVVTYTWVGVFITVLNIFLLWLFIDFFHIPTIISSTLIVGGLFVLKFWVYKKAGFTE